jgi:alpha-L-rhamnosidase
MNSSFNQDHALSTSGEPLTGSLQVKNLRVEHLENPLGIDTIRPRLSWMLEAAGHHRAQTAYQVLASTDPNPHETGRGDLWDSGRIESNESLHITYAGPALGSRQRVWWTVRVWDEAGRTSEFAEPAFFEMGLLHPDDWQAQWIGLEQGAIGPHLEPCPLLRSRFTLEAVVRRARLYATARGVYELRLNGQRVGDALFAPGWTDYRERIQYQTYDVTHLLKPGSNILGAILGHGWYSGLIGFSGNKRHYGQRPQLLAQLEIELADGTTQTITSNGEWNRWHGTTGPIHSSDFLLGEHHDARNDLPGWDTAAFDAPDWKPVSTHRGTVPLVADRAQPVRILETRHALAMTTPQPGTHIFDLGQNIVGWARLRINGATGTRVQLRFSEVLNPDGTLYIDSLRTATSTDSYTMRGGEGEVWEPQFTFHGFRYVELTGFPGTPTLETITGVVVGSDTPTTGEFACSSDLVNQLWSNIAWSQRGNFLSIPTDCPQRDERLGWLGDAQVFARTAAYNADVAAFFGKWMIDVEDAQSPNGAFPDVAPRLVDEADGAPGWGDAGVIVPWVIYQHYADTAMLERHWHAMVRWMDYIEQANPTYLRRERLNANFGDWLAQDGPDPTNAFGSLTPKDLLATAYWAYSADLMTQIAEVIGRKPEADRFNTLFERIKTVFNQAYVDPDGRIDGDTQTGYALALNLDLLPENLRPSAAKHLVANIERHGGHLTTGFLGVGHLCPALTKTGYLETAYKLLLKETFPSWGYSIANGATTIWERWDGWTAEKGFQDPAMNSFNHYSLGSVGQWLYQTVAGIDTLEPGFSHLLIAPQPGGGLTWVRAAYQSVRGRIESEWQLDGARFNLRVSVPANVTATVRLPYPIDYDPERMFRFRLEDGLPVFEIGSGHHEFIARFKPIEVVA